MKRFTCLFIGVFLILALCACNGQEDESSVASTEQSVNESKAESKGESTDESVDESTNESIDESDAGVSTEDSVIFAEPATDEFLADESKYHFCTDGSDNGSHVLITTAGKITNVRLFTLTPLEGISDSVMPLPMTATEVFFTLEYLDESKPLVAKIELSDKMPAVCISYVDAQGALQYYTVTESAEDGSLTVASHENIREGIGSLYALAKLQNARDIGELQPETKEIILIDGKYYQSYVSASHDARYVFLSADEFDMSATWDWLHIGTKDDYDLKNAGQGDDLR